MQILRFLAHLSCRYLVYGQLICTPEEVDFGNRWKWEKNPLNFFQNWHNTTTYAPIDLNYVSSTTGDLPNDNIYLLLPNILERIKVSYAYAPNLAQIKHIHSWQQTYSLR